MRVIIKGVICDTDTATVVAGPGGGPVSDFKQSEVYLYQTPNGDYFFHTITHSENQAVETIELETDKRCIESFLFAPERW